MEPNDEKTIKQTKPKPPTEEELREAIDILIIEGLIKEVSPGVYVPVTD